MKKYYRRTIEYLYFNSYYYHYMQTCGELDDREFFMELNREYQDQLMDYIRGKTPRMLHYLRMDKDGTLDNIMRAARAAARHRTRGMKRRMNTTYTMGLRVVTEHERDFLRQRDGW